MPVKYTDFPTNNMPKQTTMHNLLPLSDILLITGILSYQEISFLQLGQEDLGFTMDKFLGILYIQTFAKLPKTKPKMIIITHSNIIKNS